MSAFMVSNRHVAALACFAVDQSLANAPAKAIARELLNENGLSVSYRYRDSDLGDMGATPKEIADTFHFEDVTLPSVWAVLVASCCYDYQACEHPGYAASAAHSLAMAIRARCCELLNVPNDPERFRKYEGWSSAPWGVAEFDEVTA